MQGLYRRGHVALFVAFILLGSLSAHATVLQAPLGGRSITLPDRVVCGGVTEGWAVSDEGRRVRPPSAASGTVGQAVEVRVARSEQGCSTSEERLTLVATGPIPEVDPASVVFAPDEGRLELRGEALAGARVFWASDAAQKQTTETETCLAPTGAERQNDPQSCVLPVRRGLPTDVPLHLLPAGARFGDDVITFSAAGRRLTLAELRLRPGRILLASVLPASNALDLSSGGEGRIVLPHPEAVAAVDCGVARCELVDDGILVRTVPGMLSQLHVRLRLAPRVFLARGDALETTASALLQFLRCPVTIVSGAPLRDADETQVVVRVDDRCARDVRAYRWSANGDEAEVIQVVREDGAAFVLLRMGRLISDRVTLIATRSELDATVIATTSVATLAAPRPRASLELSGFGKVDFIPTNREAVLTVASPGEGARFVPLAVEGAYAVRTEGERVLIRGDALGSGFAQLRFGYRANELPVAFRSVDLAVVHERTQRALREASVPVSFSATGDEPLIEFICSDREGNPKRIRPGEPARIPFESRDSCRVVIHRNRLRHEDGLQVVVLEVEVTSANGASRPEARVRERMVLQPGAEARTLWIKNVTEQFDRIVVRISHEVDESRYLLPTTTGTNLPVAQWAATVEGSRLRLYATATIPSGLYRLNKPTGQLTLNFGLLSRLTWLDEHGKEGPLGAELGVMGVGLVQTGGALRQYPATLAIVAGLGVRVPLGGGTAGGQAALSIHAWGAYEFRDPFFLTNEDGSQGPEVGRWALIFGPSLSIGNIGTNL